MNSTPILEQDENQVKKTCHYEISQMTYLDEDKSNFLSAIKKGFGRNYKVYVWNFSGKIELSRYINRFNTMIKKAEAFRTVYVYQNVSKPIGVVCENVTIQFPVTDLRKHTVEKQKLVLRSAAAAMTRRLYDPQKDFPIKIMAYITSDSRIKVIMGLYPVPGFPYATRGIRHEIFDGLDFDEKFTVADGQTINSINEAVVKACKTYWGQTLSPIEKGLLVPGIEEKRNADCILSTVNHTFKDIIAYSIQQYAKDQNITLETLFTECWGELLGLYNGHQKPVLIIKKHGEMLQLCPVKIDRSIRRKERWENIQTQLSNFKKYSSCSFRDICVETTADPLKCFYAVFEIQLEDEDAVYSYAEDNIAPVINIKISRTGESYTLTYSYDAGTVLLESIEKLHNVFCEVVEDTVCGRKLSTEKWKDIFCVHDDSATRIKTSDEIIKTLFVNKELMSEEALADLDELTGKTRLVSYVQEDAILESDNVNNHVGIILSGNVEERYVSFDNMVKTISILKKGDIVNLEGITSRLSPFSYYAVEDVVVLWIYADELKKYMNLYPQCWSVLLDKMLVKANKMKKLWGLE